MHIAIFEYTCLQLRFHIKVEKETKIQIRFCRHIYSVNQWLPDSNCIAPQVSYINYQLPM